MSEYPPDIAVPLPDDITQTTPAQFADWYAAEAAYRTGVGAYHLGHGGDPRAAAEAFSASASAYAVSALARALMEHAPDAVAGVVSDINATATAGDVSDRAGEWLHEIGEDGLALHEAGREDTAEARGHAQMEGEARAYRGGRIDGARDAEDGLARRIAALEDLIADQADALERQSRDIEDLRAAMGNAQAAIRGLGTYYTAEGDG